MRLCILSWRIIEAPFCCTSHVLAVLADIFGIGSHITPIFRDPRTGGARTCGDFVLNYNIVDLKRFPASLIQTGPAVPAQRKTAYPYKETLNLREPGIATINN